MKKRVLFLIWILSLTLCSCKDDYKADALELSAYSFDDIGSEGGTMKVDIACHNPWTASSSAESWCRVTPQSGQENGTLIIDVAANTDMEPRKAIITVISNGINKEIKISQKAADVPADWETYHYTLPVIFHVLYKDKNDPLQYVPQSRLAEILERVNALYKGNGHSPDMNLTFTLAATGPDGKTLDTPGAEYIARTDYPINPVEFMNDNKGKYTSLLWDPNKYINVMVYNFAPEEGSDETTLGISHLPFSVAGANYLEGLNKIRYSYLELKNLSFAYCVSINSLFINYQSNAVQYTPSDVTVTTAHELGHYLGLYHPFAENGNGDYSNGCEDTDYCLDTPTYNRVFYTEWVNARLAAGERALSTLSRRKNCKTGEEFLSINIMDYAFGYQNHFTQDQHSRMRHVLLYSPLIPGPKKDRTKVHPASGEVLDLPIRIMK